MPIVFSGQDDPVSVKVRLGGIRRLPLFRFLPYFSNLSKPRLRLTLSFNDPKKRFRMGEEVSINCPSADLVNRPKPWTGRLPLGKEIEVTLEVITQSGVLDYELAVPLYYKTVGEDIQRTTWSRIRILNTGTIRSGEDAFLYGIGFVLNTIVTSAITSVLWWRFG